MTESELLFSEIRSCDRASLYLDRDMPLSRPESALAASALKRRIQAEPIQYILGKTEFMGLEFKVTPDVFIPRPETELLVETAIRMVSRLAGEPVSRLNVLDLGTGSGCIAVSLAKYLANCHITATDISEAVLRVARENAKLNSVIERITFLRSNLFESSTLCPMPYALCISNPPYIPTAEIDKLQPEIQYEPRIALDGGRDGLDFYRRIAGEAVRHLKNKGFLILEMGYGQREAIEGILDESRNFEIIEVVKDYNDIDRVIVAKISV